MGTQNTDATKDVGRLWQTTIAKNAPMNSAVARSRNTNTLLSLIVTEPDFDKRMALNRQLMKQVFDIDCMIDILYQAQ